YVTILNIIMKFLSFLISKVFLKNLSIAILIATGVIFGSLLFLHIYTHHGRLRQVPDFKGMSPEEVEKAAKIHKLQFVFIDSIYSQQVERGHVVLQHPEPGFNVKKNRKIFLTINAVKPEMVKVPNVVGLSLRQAKSLLQTSGLIIGKLSFVPDLARNNVLKQKNNGIEIEEGDSLKKNAVIDLVLGKGLSNQKTHVPDLVSLELETAKQKILGSSLNLGAYTFDETIKNEEDSITAFIWKQNPEYAEDYRIPLGSSVYIWLTVDSTKLPQTDITTIELELDREI
ncbi:MAG: PASTA domain-containing protein, partial [Bacteroidales bacterium]|nr:PASTA domain-containing protein [Bacteroidales bacterium]